jgi:hypothetical protein
MDKLKNSNINSKEVSAISENGNGIWSQSQKMSIVKITISLVLFRELDHLNCCLTPHNETKEFLCSFNRNSMHGLNSE